MARNSVATLSGLASLIALGTVAPPAVAAQGFRIQPTVQPEVRAFAAIGNDWSAGAGVGFNVPAGYYLRVAPMVAVGRRFEDDARNFSRAEIIGRFTLDPFHERRWGPWVGAGLAGEWVEARAGRALIVAAAGADFPGRAGWRPSLELAVGGGARLSLSLKHTRRTGR